MVEAQEVMDTAEAAQFLGFSVEHVRVMARAGRVPAVKLGHEWRFSRRQLLEWLEHMAIPEALVEQGLVEQAQRRLAESEGRVPFEEVRARLGL